MIHKRGLIAGWIILLTLFYRLELFSADCDYVITLLAIKNTMKFDIRKTFASYDC